MNRANGSLFWAPKSNGSIQTGGVATYLNRGLSFCSYKPPICLIARLNCRIWVRNFRVSFGRGINEFWKVALNFEDQKIRANEDNVRKIVIFPSKKFQKLLSEKVTPEMPTNFANENIASVIFLSTSRWLRNLQKSKLVKTKRIRGLFLHKQWSESARKWARNCRALSLKTNQFPPHCWLIVVHCWSGRPQKFPEASTQTQSNKQTTDSFTIWHVLFWAVLGFKNLLKTNVR